jgi:hypothetical protein
MTTKSNLLRVDNIIGSPVRQDELADNKSLNINQSKKTTARKTKKVVL